MMRKNAPTDHACTDLSMFLTKALISSVVSWISALVNIFASFPR